jgi:hypothetical protein
VYPLSTCFAERFASLHFKFWVSSLSQINMGLSN